MGILFKGGDRSFAPHVHVWLTPFSILTTVGGSPNTTGFGYRGPTTTNNSGKTTYLSPHMGIVLPPGLSLTSPAAHGSSHGHNSIITSNQVMRTRSPHTKYRGPQGTITLKITCKIDFSILFFKIVLLVVLYNSFVIIFIFSFFKYILIFFLFILLNIYM